jgi:hypothetical protein
MSPGDSKNLFMISKILLWDLFKNIFVIGEWLHVVAMLLMQLSFDSTPRVTIQPYLPLLYLSQLSFILSYWLITILKKKSQQITKARVILHFGLIHITSKTRAWKKRNFLIYQKSIVWMDTYNNHFCDHEHLCFVQAKYRKKGTI